MKLIPIALILSFLLFSGCAATRFQVQPSDTFISPCQQSPQKLTAAVFWLPQWRADQKDVPQREAAAQKGIESFFQSSDCFNSAKVQRLDSQWQSKNLTGQDLQKIAMSQELKVDRLILIRVKELGPVIKLFSHWSGLEGGTEVVLDVQVYAGQSTAAFDELNVHWQNGGPWVIKGVASLEQDMLDCLQHVFHD